MHRAMNLAVFAVLLAAMQVGWAQPTPDVGVSAQAGSPSADKALPEWITRVEGVPGLFNVRFPGGSLEEYLRGMELLTPEGQYPMALTADVGRVSLPPFNLDRVGWWMALNAPSKLREGISIEPSGGGQTVKTPDGPVRESSYYFVRVDPNLLVAEVETPPTFDLDFPGGPLADYIAALREKNPDANLMLTGSVDLAVVPGVSLKNITTKTAIGVLPDSMQEAATESYIIYSRIVDNAGGEPVFMVEVRSQGKRSSAAPQATVISLAELLRARGTTALKIEDVLSAIEAATSMVGAEAPKMRYHAETRLLLFSGYKSQIDVMHATLDALGVTADALE